MINSAKTYDTYEMKTKNDYILKLVNDYKYLGSYITSSSSGSDPLVTTFSCF